MLLTEDDNGERVDAKEKRANDLKWGEREKNESEKKPHT